MKKKLSKDEFNKLFGWISKFDPDKPESISKEIDQLTSRLHTRRLEFYEAAVAQAQAEAYDAFRALFKGHELTEEQEENLKNVGHCIKCYEEAKRGVNL